MKVLKNFESLSQPAELFGKPDQPVHWVQFSGMKVLALFFFVSVLSHSVSELYTVFFLVSLLYKECSEKFSELFSTGWTGWGTGSTSFFGFCKGRPILV